MYTIDCKQQNKPYPLGVTTEVGYTYFSVVMKNETDCGIILYDKRNGEQTRIPFKSHHRHGSIYSMTIKDLDTGHYTYNFYEGEHIFTDPYAKVIYGHEKWGTSPLQLQAGFLTQDYDWEDDMTLKIPYENSILYCLNVRAFTKHKSSGVTHKGTFKGLTEKIPHLKDLGITAIELMPVYEYEEIEKNKCFSEEESCNCWGYKNGFYFAPKASYSFAADAVTEFKDMVKMLHKNGIEVILQFYFPNNIKMGMILDVIKYWILEYHIDGIHLKGERIPLQAIATDPLLSDTKLFYYDFPYDMIYEENEKPCYRNLASYKDDYMYAIRRLLKGDDGMIHEFLECQRRNPLTHGVINYVTNYYGFTLADMVSYEQKHNEANGENNNDGNDCNFTWNCGVEGITRKKQILELRTRQRKNALTMLFMAQGTPLIYSGDELGNTRFGNNNPYCQDNETGWIKWNMNAQNKEVYAYLKQLIALRKGHPILHAPDELKILDYTGCGYPDLSYHGEEAWRPDLNHYSRFVGVMYCGCYANKSQTEEDDFFYVAYNMHWLPHTFALPKLPKGMKWHLVADTSHTQEIVPDSTAGKDICTLTDKNAQEAPYTEVEARTIRIYQSKQEEGAKPDARKKYSKSAF